MIPNELLVLVNFIVLVFGLIGGYFGLRYSMSRARMDIQAQIREDLTTENIMLRNKLADLEKEYQQLRADMRLVFTTLKKSFDLEIEIDDGVVTVRDKKNHTFYTLSSTERHQEE